MPQADRYFIPDNIHILDSDWLSAVQFILGFISGKTNNGCCCLSRAG